MEVSQLHDDSKDVAWMRRRWIAVRRRLVPMYPRRDVIPLRVDQTVFGFLLGSALDHKVGFPGSTWRIYLVQVVVVGKRQKYRHIS